METFNQLYSLGHAYFGASDAIGRQNIIDLSIGLTWKAAPQLSVIVGGHTFRVDRTEDAIYNAGGGGGRPGGSYLSSQVGREIDVTARWNASRHVVFGGGYGHFFAGDAINQRGPADDIDFGYVETTFTF